MNTMRQRTLNVSNHKVSSHVTDIAVAADNLCPRLSVLLSRVVKAACPLSFHTRDAEKFSPAHLLIYPLLAIFTLFTFAVDAADPFTILYSGEEHGQLGLHGCGTEQVGGLAHRQTLISNLCTKREVVLNLHTGNLIDPSDANAEWVYQIGLSALDAMAVDVLCLGPNELSLPLETLAALHTDQSKLGFVCANATPRIGTPYLIRAISAVNVAIVGLVSERHARDLSTVDLTPSQTVLAKLKADILSRSDIVVVVFHATQYLG